MDQIEFADGFDRPDKVAFGLSAGQLAVVMVGVLGAYSLVRSPLPTAIVDPFAVLIAGVAAGLGWLQFGGRPMLDWATRFGSSWPALVMSPIWLAAPFNCRSPVPAMDNESSPNPNASAC